MLHLFRNMNCYIKENLEWFDTENYPENNIYGISKTISVVGKMKDKFARSVLKRFYGLMAKTYCVSTPEKEMKKKQRVTKSVVKQQLNSAINNSY